MRWGGVMRYIESGRAKMRIEESAAKKQVMVYLGRDVVVGVNKYRIDKDDGDDGNRSGDGNEGGGTRWIPLVLITPL